MEIRVSVLSENTAGGNRALGEFGWSVFIEVDEQKILFDTGLGHSACHNASMMGIDLGQVDKIVLSHSHHDHTGGLREILLRRNARPVEIIAHPHVWAERYNRHSDQDEYMGIPFQRAELESLGARFNLVAHSLAITPNALTSGEIPMNTAFENESMPAFGGKGRILKEGSEIRTDTILDDMALFVKTERGLVVILGCAHRGIINTLAHARNITQMEQIDTVIGGAHLMSESKERIEKTIAALKEFGVRRLGLCHCTGPRAVSRLVQEYQERFFFCNAGTAHTLP